MASERDRGMDFAANPFLLTFTQFEREGRNVVRMQIAKHLGMDPDVYEWESERRLTSEELSEFASWNEQVVLRAILTAAGRKARRTTDQHTRSRTVRPRAHRA